MNHLLTETYNIDTDIQYVQTVLYNGLTNAWNTDKLDAYGRVYRYEYDFKTIPHVYSSVTKDYEATLYNDQSSFFFIDDVSHDTDDEKSFTTKVKIVFMVNFDDIKTSEERLDSAVKRDVISLLRNNDKTIKVIGYESTIDEVFRGFDTSDIKGFRADKHPLHVFAIVCEINYVVNDKCD